MNFGLKHLIILVLIFCIPLVLTHNLTIRLNQQNIVVNLFSFGQLEEKFDFALKNDLFSLSSRDVEIEAPYNWTTRSTIGSIGSLSHPSCSGLSLKESLSLYDLFKSWSTNSVISLSCEREYKVEKQKLYEQLKEEVGKLSIQDQPRYFIQTYKYDIIHGLVGVEGTKQNVFYDSKSIMNFQTLFKLSQDTYNIKGEQVTSDKIVIDVIDTGDSFTLEYHPLLQQFEGSTITIYKGEKAILQLPITKQTLLKYLQINPRGNNLLQFNSEFYTYVKSRLEGLGYKRKVTSVARSGNSGSIEVTYHETIDIDQIIKDLQKSLVNKQLLENQVVKTSDKYKREKKKYQYIIQEYLTGDTENNRHICTVLNNSLEGENLSLKFRSLNLSYSEELMRDVHNIVSILGQFGLVISNEGKDTVYGIISSKNEWNLLDNLYVNWLDDRNRLFISDKQGDFYISCKQEGENFTISYLTNTIHTKDFNVFGPVTLDSGGIKWTLSNKEITTKFES